MIHRIYLSLLCWFLLQTAVGQDCTSAMKRIEQTYLSSYTHNVADSILIKADYYATYPPHRECIQTGRYYIVLSDLYFSVMRCRQSSIEQELYALDKAAEYMLKAGEIDSLLISDFGEGASRLADIYLFKTNILFNLKDQKQYDEAVRQKKYWQQISSGENKRKQQEEHRQARETAILQQQIEQEQSKNNSVPPKLAVTPSQKRKVEYVPRTYDLKYLSAITGDGDQFRFLTGDQVSYTIVPETKITRFFEAERHQATALFGEGVKYKITVNSPGFEQQFFELTPSVDRMSYDTIFIPLFKEGTPVYYTCCDTRSFEPDSFSIRIIHNYALGEEPPQLQQLIENLGLERTTDQVYRKRSGEAFRFDGDSVLTVLRQQTKYILYAGPDVGIKNRMAVLTHHIHITWKTNPEDRTEEEQKQVEILLKKYQLKHSHNDVFIAPSELGLKINTIVHQLNTEPMIHVAYPDVYQPITLKTD